MVFQIVSVIVPIVLYAMSVWLLGRAGKDARRYRRWLLAACGLFFVSWYLPSPLIDGQDTAFTTHFLGGGVFTGLYWYYLKQTLGWQGSWVVEGVSLFVLVSALGVMNELFELLLKQTHLSRLTLTDTNWDLLANTLGALLFFGFYSVCSGRYSKTRR